jgi:hypothetical protein
MDRRGSPYWEYIFHDTVNSAPVSYCTYVHYTTSGIYLGINSKTHLNSVNYVPMIVKLNNLDGSLVFIRRLPL